MSKIYAYSQDGTVSSVNIGQSQSINIGLAVKSFLSTGQDISNLFSYTINIPTQKNKPLIDKYLSRTNSNDNNIRAVLELSFLAFPGFLKVTGCNNDFTTAQFIGGICNWTSILPEFTRDLPLGDSLYSEVVVGILTLDGTEQPYSGASPLWYSLKKYNGWTDPGIVSFTDLRPDIHLKFLIESISSYTGYPIKSNLFNTDWFRKIVEPYTGDGRMEYLAFSYECTTPFSSPLLTFTPNDTNFTISDDPLNYGPQTSFPVPVSDKDVDVTVNIELNLAPNFIGAGVVILSNSAMQIYDSLTLTNDTVQNITLKGSFQSINDIVVTIDGFVPNSFLVGTKLEFIFNSDPVEGSVIYHRSIFPSGQKLIDRINGLSKSFNLMWFFDGGILTVDPKWDVTLPTGEFVSGFYRNIAQSDDWRSKHECKKDIDNNVNNSIKRNLIHAYKNDSNNKDVDEMQWAHTAILSSSHSEGNTTKANPFYSAIVNRKIDPNQGGVANPAIVPTFLSGKEGTDYDFCPVMLYKMGIANGNVNRGSLTLDDTYPMAAQVALASDFDFVSINVHNANLGYADYKGVPGLFSLFYQKDIDILNSGHRRRIKISIDYMVLSNIQEFFRRLKLAGGGCEESFYLVDKISIVGDEYANVDLISVR